MTKIEWAQKTWNPTIGCSRCSPGCDSCYAITQAAREMQPAHVGITEQRDGRTDWTGELRLLPDRLEVPLRWRKPYRVFVDSMSDLFHVDVPDDYIDEVFAVMAGTQAQFVSHSFQILTKRHQRMHAYMNTPDRHERVIEAANRLCADDRLGKRMYHAVHWLRYGQDVWPLPNVWLGVSVENQRYADLRIPVLLDTPAAIHWISAEPLLGAVKLHRWIGGLDWVVVGGESGRHARPMHPEWVRRIRETCTRSGTPMLMKQWGQWSPGQSSSWSGRSRATASHLMRVDGTLVTVDEATSVIDGIEQDFIDRGHPGWARMRRMRSKHDAGRELDGRTWDEYPVPA